MKSCVMAARAAALCALLGAISGEAAAQALQKCTGPDGKVAYTNQGCPSSTVARGVSITDSTVDMRQDLIASDRINRERAAESARLRAQVAIGIRDGPANGKGQAREPGGASGKECGEAAPRGLSSQEKAEFLAACMSGQPMAQRPARPNPPPTPQAPKAMFCSGPPGNMFCY